MCVCVCGGGGGGGGAGGVSIAVYKQLRQTAKCSNSPLTPAAPRPQREVV